MAIIDVTVGAWLVLAPALLTLLFSSTARGWRLAIWLSGFNLALTLLLWLASLNTPILAGVLRLAFLPSTLLVLVSFLAWIIYRYAATNFQADVDATRFLRWLTLTILAVQVLVLANHLVLFWLAWVSVSLSLHQLLMFYPNRPRARLAAHKKFLIARGSEVLLGLAFLLIYLAHNSLSITHILSQYPLADFSWQLQLATLLLATVALLKCAQLPLHGWLIQVVESPTPVSALLHAGVVNLGGVLLLLFAPLLSQAVSAQWLLLLVAGPSAVLAALIMTTRISIKVRLAWSTCAQMGMMLIECALGLYEIALLHLIAHSCYKARAFLSAGSAVNQHLLHQVGTAMATRAQPNVWAWSIAVALVIPLLLAGAFLWAQFVQPSHSDLIAPWLVISFAFVVYAAHQFAPTTSAPIHRWRNGGRAIATLAGLLLLYLLVKTLLANQLGLHQHLSSLAADVWVSGLLLVLMIGHFVLQLLPHHAAVRRTWIALNAGLYLDEWMTRFTLRWWPVTLTPSAVSQSFLDAEVKS